MNYIRFFLTAFLFISINNTMLFCGGKCNKQTIYPYVPLVEVINNISDPVTVTITQRQKRNNVNVDVTLYSFTLDKNQTRSIRLEDSPNQRFTASYTSASDGISHLITFGLRGIDMLAELRIHSRANGETTVTKKLHAQN